MSVLGDRIVNEGPYTAARDYRIPVELEAVEWNALRQELIDLRAQVQAYADDQLRRDEAVALLAASPPMVPGLTAAQGTAYRVGELMGLRPCPVCLNVMIGPALVECRSCAGAEDAAAKRREDQ